MNPVFKDRADFDSQAGGEWLKIEGEFLFTIDAAEVKPNSKGGDQVVITCSSDAGNTTLYLQLQDKALWNYRRLLMASLQITKDMLDEKMNGNKMNEKYLVVHNELIGKQFIGISKKQAVYDKKINVEQTDGTIVEKIVTKDGGYRVDTYYPNL